MSHSESKVCWRVTRYCNLECVHCLAGHGNASRRDLSPQEKLQAVTNIASAQVSRITWTGGEPTFCKDLPALLSVCHEFGVRSAITTHGLALRSAILDNFDPTTDRFRFSFDGGEETHNEIRGGPFFRKAMTNLTRVMDLGVVVEVNITVMGRNIFEIPDLIDTLANRGVSKIVLLSLMARENAVDNALAPPSTEEFNQLRRKVGEFSTIHPDTVIQVNDYSAQDDTYIVIESDGEIMLCSESYGDSSFGSIIEPNGVDKLRVALESQTLAHRSHLGPS